MLDDMRRYVIEEELGLTEFTENRELHLNHDTWGYLKTVPALEYREGTSLPDLNLNELNEKAIAERFSEPHMKEKLVVAYIDISRMALNIINDLLAFPPSDIENMANKVMSRTEFGNLISSRGGVFDFFTGVAGGMKIEYTPGTHINDRDLTYEIVGRLSIPIIFSGAAQMSLEIGDGWAGYTYKAGANFPRIMEMVQAFGLPEFTGVALRILETPLAYEHGICVEEYLQFFEDRGIFTEIYSQYQQDFLRINRGEFMGEGFTANIDKLFSSPEDVGFAFYGRGKGRMINPFSRLFSGREDNDENIIQESSTIIAYKQNDEIGYGATIEADFHGQICGDELGVTCPLNININGVIGSRFKKTGITEIPSPINEPLDFFTNLANGFEGGLANSLQVTGTIMGFDINEASETKIAIFGDDWSSPDKDSYGIKIKYKILNQDLWTVITGRGIYAGLGPFPNPGDTVPYISAQLRSQVLNIFGEEIKTTYIDINLDPVPRQVGSWGGWSGEGIELFTNESASEFINTLRSSYGGVFHGRDACREESNE